MRPVTGVLLIRPVVAVAGWVAAAGEGAAHMLAVRTLFLPAVIRALGGPKPVGKSAHQHEVCGVTMGQADSGEGRRRCRQRA